MIVGMLWDVFRGLSCCHMTFNYSNVRHIDFVGFLFGVFEDRVCCSSSQLFPCGCKLLGVETVQSKDIVLGIPSWSVVTVCAGVKMTKWGPAARGNYLRYHLMAILSVADVDNVGLYTKES